MTKIRETKKKSTLAERALIEKTSFDHSCASTIVQRFQSQKPRVEMNDVKIVNVHSGREKQIDALRLIYEFLALRRQANGCHLIDFHCAFENLLFMRRENGAV